MKEAELILIALSKKNTKLLPKEGLTCLQFACFIAFKSFVEDPSILTKYEWSRKQKHDFKNYLIKGLSCVKEE